MSAASTVVGCTQGECGNRLKRTYKPDSSFWDEGNLERELWAKQLALDPDDGSGDRLAGLVQEFKCQIGGCNKWFNTILSYESHYNAAHRYACNMCRRMFPTARLLELHVLETHDNLFALLAKKQKMYECLVLGCGLKFATDKDREKHLIDLHHYPKEFAFHYRRRRHYKRRKGKNKGKRQSRKTERKDQQRTVEMIDATAEMLSQMEMDKSSTAHTQESEEVPTNAFTAQLMGQSGRVYACKVPETFSFGRRGRGARSHNAQGDRRGRGNRGRGGRGRGRSDRGKADETVVDELPDREGCGLSEKIPGEGDMKTT